MNFTLNNRTLVVNVELTAQEDTDGNLQITIEDSGPKAGFSSQGADGGDLGGSNGIIPPSGARAVSGGSRGKLSRGRHVRGGHDHYDDRSRVDRYGSRGRDDQEYINESRHPGHWCTARYFKVYKACKERHASALLTATTHISRLLF